MSESEVRFQQHAFDPDLSGKRGVGELHQFFGDEIAKPGYSSGFQVKNFRTGYRRRSIPPWAQTCVGIQNVLLTAFPKLKVDDKHRKRAGRWAQVITLFYKNGWSESEVAKEISTTIGNVRRIIVGMNRTAKGVRSDGRGERKRTHIDS